MPQYNKVLLFKGKTVPFMSDSFPRMKPNFEIKRNAAHFSSLYLMCAHTFAFRLHPWPFSGKAWIAWIQKVLSEGVQL